MLSIANVLSMSSSILFLLWKVSMKFSHCDYHMCVILVLTEISGLDGGDQVVYFGILKANDHWGLNFALELSDSKILSS